MSLDLAPIRALLARINAPKGWAYMGEDGAFPLEIRECDSFREVVTLKADPNDLAEAIAELPTALAAAVADVDRLTSELAALATECAQHRAVAPRMKWVEERENNGWLLVIVVGGWCSHVARMRRYGESVGWWLLPDGVTVKNLVSLPSESCADAARLIAGALSPEWRSLVPEFPAENV